jgi:uncharacterized membrane protein YidH (DUF202 family)
MADTPAPGEEPPYRAFISYSHADDRFATWLHRKLEGWRLPDGGRLAPIFIDRAELSAGTDLSVQVRDGLARSQALVVIASPSAKASRWVGKEIALFRQISPEKPILTALLTGEPEAAFPLPLVEHDGQTFEPLAADFRKQGDGRRLALLKIVAGLSGLPLDSLVQRDARARQRRVMAVTAATALLVVVLSTMLVFALRAQAEAERQRAQAEGMVEFMLTDLRDRLKGVGRLDIMDAVNARAMEHYGGESDLGSLPPDVLLRRAKLLQAMGADAIDRAGFNPAMADVRERGADFHREAWRETKHLLDQEPDDAERIFAHAQSEYYLGAIELSDPSRDRKERTKSTRPHYLAYRDLARKLVKIDPKNVDWLRELAYGEGNVCQIGIDLRDDLKATLQACHNSRVAMEQVWRANPDNLNDTLNLANELAWEADARLATGDPETGIALRQRQLELTGQAVRNHPKDMRAILGDMLARLGFATFFVSLKRWDEAEVQARLAADRISAMRRSDPANGDWKDREGQVGRLLEAIRRRETDDGRRK